MLRHPAERSGAFFWRSGLAHPRANLAGLLPFKGRDTVGMGLALACPGSVDNRLGAYHHSGAGNRPV